MFTKKFQEWVRGGARHLVPTLRSLGLTPNALTITGLIVTAVASVLVGLGLFTLGGITLLAAAAFDILDGAVARVTGKMYRYGAFLDSTSDRYAEVFAYVALLYYFSASGQRRTTEAMLVIASLSGSLLVSYIRARAQSLGFACDGGLLARPERVIITVIGLIVPVLLVPALWVLAVLSNVTALQRIWFVWSESRRLGPADVG